MPPPPPPNPPGPPPPPPPGGPGGPGGKPLPELIFYFWRFLRQDARKSLVVFILLVLAALTPAVMGMMPSWLGRYWSPQGLPTLWWILGGMFAIVVLYLPDRLLADYLSSKIVASFSQRLRLAIFSKIGKLPSQQMSFQSMGELAHRNTADVMMIQSFLMPRLFNNVINLFQAIFLTISLFSLHVIAAASILVVLAILLAVVSRLNRALASLVQRSQEENGQTLNRFIEGVVGYRDLVASGRFEQAARAFDEGLQRLRRLAVRTSVMNGLGTVLPMLGMNVVVFGVYFFMLGMSTENAGNQAYLGKVISITVVVTALGGTVLQLMGFLIDSALTGPSFAAVHRLLESQEVRDAPQAAALSGGGLRFENVGFTYGAGGPPVLDNVSFTIEPGSFTAIVGQTGSGKTTLFHLLLRLLEPSRGKILIGGHDLGQVSLVDLRRFVGFIPQNPFIFDSTIRDNILMGADAKEGEGERLTEAVAAARLDSLVQRRQRDGGLDARVGVGGATLSGGERQRVALARILVRNPDIIICDEYTANIDNATASLIQKALAERFRGKTRIVITHQLYSIRDADRILVLDHGSIVDQGAHEDLIRRTGLYREMWEVQKL